MVKRKDQNDPSVTTTPSVKKPRVSAAATALTAAATATPAPKSFVEIKDPAHTTMTRTMEVKASKKNPYYGFGKPPTSEGIIKALETCINPGIPLHSLVHPDAAKLYESVKDPDDFFIANHLFWATFFINQRGCPASLLGNLLTQLVSTNTKLVGATEEEAIKYGEAFRRVHDSIENGFIAATDSLSQEWISSPAGVTWLAELAKARKAKRTIVNLKIDETHLKGLTIDGEFYQGIELGNVYRMWHHWGQVLYVTNIKKVGKNGSFWPEDDLTRGITLPDSLLLRLHRAMIGALVAVINVQAPNHGRARRILSDPDTTQNILHAAYTEGSLTAPKTNDGRHMPEHIRMIKVRSLAEWSDHLPTGNHESEEDNETKNSAFSPLSTGSTCAPCDNPLSDWKDGIPQDIVEEAETDEKRAEEVMLKVMKDNVPEYILSNIPFDSIFSAADYPPQRIQPLASALATELTYFNWWGRTYLHIREGRARIQRLEGLMLSARMEIKEIKKREKELEAEKKGLEAAAKMYEDIQKELRTRQENEQSLRRNVRELKKHPVLDAGVKGFHATARVRSMSNPESPAKSVSSVNVSCVDVVPFPGVEMGNDHPKTGERYPDFDLDDDDDEEEAVSSEDGMSEDELDAHENLGDENIDPAEEKLKEVVDKDKEKEKET